MCKSYVPGVKTATIKTSTQTFYLDIVTQFSQSTPLTTICNRHLLFNVYNVVAQCRNSNASWEQTGYGSSWLDGKLICSLTIQGILRYGAMEFGLLDASYEFYCSEHHKIY